MVSNKKVGPITIIIDLFRFADGWFYFVSFIAFLISIIIGLKFGYKIRYNIIACSLLDSIPTILGFVMTGLTIIMGLNSKYIKRLSERANDGKTPIRVIIASFVSCFVFLIITYLLSLFLKGIVLECNGCQNLLGSLLLFCTIESALLLIHVVFHLFATSTHLVEY